MATNSKIYKSILQIRILREDELSGSHYSAEH
jgi:hypothetical protein